MSSRNNWSADPDINNTKSNESSIQFDGPERNLYDGWKNPDRHWKTADYKMSDQLKKLESEHAELLKTFDGYLADVKSQLAQNKTISAEKANQCSFKNYDEL